MKHVLLIVALCALGACGVKPSSLSPPDASRNTYPRTYPDRNTDPTPVPGY